MCRCHINCGTDPLRERQHFSYARHNRLRGRRKTVRLRRQISGPRASVLECSSDLNLLSGGRRMDFTALRYFNETANSRSIRAASERLHVSPSAISRQIAKLEHELRAPIFDRRSQGMVLTPAGEMLLARVEGMMREFARVKSHVAALQNLQAGTVDIYCFQAAIESFVLPTLQQFHMRYPNVFFNVTVSSAD